MIYKLLSLGVQQKMGCGLFISHITIYVHNLYKIFLCLSSYSRKVAITESLVQLTSFLLFKGSFYFFWTLLKNISNYGIMELIWFSVQSCTWPFSKESVFLFCFCFNLIYQFHQIGNTYYLCAYHHSVSKQIARFFFNTFWESLAGV